MSSKSSHATPTEPPAATDEQFDDAPTRVLDRASLDASTPSAQDPAASDPPAGAPKVTAPLDAGMNPGEQVTRAFAAQAEPSEPEEAERFDAGLTAPELPALGTPTRSAPSSSLGPRADDPAATNYYTPIPPSASGAILDEVDDEWALADQPTVQMAPQMLARVMPPVPTPERPSVVRPLSGQAPRAEPLTPRPELRTPRAEPLTPRPEPVTPRPAFLETGEQDVWPPRPTMPPAQAPTPAAAAAPTPTPIPRPPVRSQPTTGRIPSPTGRPPLRGQPAAYSSPRMRRLVELRLQRDAHKGGQRGPTDNPPVAQMVRQWWSDLLPGLATALDHQHEARESGMYPIPAHVNTPSSPLGDAFGRLASAMRELGGKARATASPALTRLQEFHDKAEQAAQAVVDRIEGPVRQQGPLLGPGRLAVFFEQGVTVGQAQRLLMTNHARPMRLIPRRHGFLALVQPGRESAVGAQLKQHPYVRDVVFMAYGAAAQAAH
jgi:hypothetical protein